MDSASNFSRRPGDEYRSKTWPGSETIGGSLLGPQSLSNTHWSPSQPPSIAVGDAIDLLIWGWRDSLKYEFHVAPGADYRQIRVRYDGIESLSLDEAGSLHMHSSRYSRWDGWFGGVVKI